MSEEDRLPPRPAWRTDFPVERVEAQHVSRREFAKYLVLVSGGFTAGSAVIAVKDDLVAAPRLPAGGTRLCAVAELPVGSSRPFVVPGTTVPAFVVRLDETTFRAFETKCTHLSCAVVYSAANGRSSAPATTGRSTPAAGPCCRGRRRVRCAASPSWYATAIWCSPARRRRERLSPCPVAGAPDEDEPGARRGDRPPGDDRLAADLAPGGRSQRPRRRPLDRLAGLLCLARPLPGRRRIAALPAAAVARGGAAGRTCRAVPTWHSPGGRSR